MVPIKYQSRDERAKGYVKGYFLKTPSGFWLEGMILAKIEMLSLITKFLVIIWRKFWRIKKEK